MAFDVRGAIYFLVIFLVMVVAVFFVCQYLDKKSQVILAECEAKNLPVPGWVKVARVLLKRSLNE